MELIIGKGVSRMSKKFALFVFFIGFVLFLTGCSQMPQSDYLVWRNSDDAEDLNGDRKIDELDYELFLNPVEDNYETWRISDEAEDLNGDRKIDELDYELFLNLVVDDYETWHLSEDALDYNGDRKIDALDYAIYLDFQNLKGTYTIVNYVYDGSETYIGNQLYLNDLGTQLESIQIILDENGNVDVQLSQEFITLLDDTYTIFVEGVENMTIERISPLLFAIDTTVTIDNVELSVSLYLTQITNGFSTSYTIHYENTTGVLSFDMIKGS